MFPFGDVTTIETSLLGLAVWPLIEIVLEPALAVATSVIPCSAANA